MQENQTIMIECDGLTLKECRELAETMKKIQGVESVDFRMKTRDYAFEPGTIRASAEPLHLIIKLAERTAEGGAFGVGAAALRHAFEKVGEGLVDGAWDWMRAKFIGKSEIPVEVMLYDAQGELIKKLKGKR